jgi:3-phenylpropionate/trans-cinnamate dioxygenase ferredoxin subunit
MQRTGQWVRIARRGEVEPGERKLILVRDRRIALFNAGGEFYAIDDVCTHDGGPLAEGDLEGYQIICPRHGARFDIRSGEVLSFPAVVPIPAYRVLVEGEEILIDLDSEE